MKGYLLDTNHLSAAIRRDSPIRHRLDVVHRRGYRLGTCWPVLCELEFGIAQTRDPESCHRTLNSLLKKLRVWSFGWKLVRSYGEISVDLQGRGRVLSFVDKVLAAMALQLNVTILTTDRDFEALPDIKTENWLPSQ